MSVSILRPGNRVLNIGENVEVFAPRGGGGAPWYDGAIVAYQPKGAASYAVSKINLANPGTYDATEGSAPNWNSSDGWIFAYQSSMWLDTNLIPAMDQTWSMIVRFSNGVPNISNYIPLMVSYATGPLRFFIVSSGWSSVGRLYGAGSQFIAANPILTEGVMALAGREGYIDGVGDLTVPSGVSSSTSVTIKIGKIDSVPIHYLSGRIQAAGVWNYTLSPSEVATISAAMAAL